MGRLLAIDLGKVRTGIAVTDPLKIIATPLETVPTASLIEYLSVYQKKEEVEAFVLGFPKTLLNEETEMTVHVKKLSEALQEKFPLIPVHLIDERFTSKMAFDAMLAGGMKKKDRRVKGNIDKISATIILQSFLDRRNVV